MTNRSTALRDDPFAVAQVALYIFAGQSALSALMTLTGAIPLPIDVQASLMQRVSFIASAAATSLCLALGYLLLARCLDRCTKLVWRVALGMFLLSALLSALAFFASPSTFPILTGGLSIAGAWSISKGRKTFDDQSDEVGASVNGGI
ncbi:hypothetical protein [Caballeronia novacaledonica]|uniref:Uncharacterized protein n=1 Tax=Caballeronia novacaledonica TaxID=1544861 RepID=A0AA37I8V5_9BURK|nr:hypothetical protein [Caballeronia novacaledonica]GJH25506.1 hypothetical protein CBA19CS42_13340 [Caballeronia novacaledonica]